VAYLLPKDPVARKHTQGGKRTSAEISDLKANPDMKSGIGKTGVHLRWHKRGEF